MRMREAWPNKSKWAMAKFLVLSFTAPSGTCVWQAFDAKLIPGQEGSHLGTTSF